MSASGGDPGRGTTMTVRVPLAEGAAERTDSGDAEPRLSAARRILVVDDNADAAMSLAMLLELEGHVTRVAHSGTEALAIAPEFAPQFVFLDIGLPDLSGYDVARRLRA